MEVVIVVAEDGTARVREANEESERATNLGGRSALARAVLPNLEHLRDRGPDWQALQDLNNPFKW